MNTYILNPKSFVFILVTILVVTFGTQSISYAQEQIPTITASFEAPLTEETLNGSVVTLTLTGKKFERATADIRAAISLDTDIIGVSVADDDINPQSDTEVTAKLTYETGMISDGTLTFTVEAGAIADYNGPALTAQISVKYNPPTITASVEAPLTEDTLNGSVVTLTLSNRKFERSIDDLNRALSVTGIKGVRGSIRDVEDGRFPDSGRISDTKVTVELNRGNFIIGSDSTLTFTVEADAIVYYSGPALIVQVPVAAYNHIEGPWLWMIAPGGNINTDNLSKTSKGAITEAQIAQNGVSEGEHFGFLQWTNGRLLPTTVCGFILCSSDNVINVVREIGLTDEAQLHGYSAYALININSPRTQNSVQMGVGSDDSIKVWLNGSVVHSNNRKRRTTNIQDKFRINLNAGENLLLVKVCNYSVDPNWAWIDSVENNDWGMFFKIYLDAEDYTVSLPIGPTKVLVIDPESPPIYWTDTGTGKIQHVNLDASKVEDLVTHVTHGLGIPSSIALDVEGGKMYWTDTDTDKIQRANLDGSEVEDLITQGLRSPYDIALDVEGGKMYWADNITDKIQCANLDGSEVEDLITQGLSAPRSIALDVIGGKIYWTDTGTDKIQRANLDGSEVEDLITQGLSAPRSITLDVIGGKIYWTDTDTDKIQRANLDGSEVEDLITQGLSAPRSITLDVIGGKIYWTDTGTDKIQRANLDGSEVEDLITQGLENPYGIALGILAPIHDGVVDVTESTQLKSDVNADGIVNIQDLVLVAGKLGQTGTDSADINGDGQINIQDLVLVAGALGTTAAAPSLHPQALEMLTTTEIKQWLSEVQQLDLTDAMSQRGILFLQQLLAKLTPKKTILLANYPNPFNPETWIPYHLAKDTDVTLHIYAVNGTLVRTLTLGHQAAGMYQNRSRAAYWDGKNELGEKVASGLYFYTLTAGDFTATRKMLIMK